ncbi:MAG: SDR family NAD(P)-dependent oxidoreductase [Nitrosopumilaceae archaeon]|jgi:NAD(P)-dependent dehydrogenase (short-subunit alcohol dehydrogenase family)
MNTNQKTAVVTGSSSGIGLAVAEGFVREGFNVVLNGRNKDKLDNAAAQIGSPDQLSIITGDVTNPEAADQIVNKAVERFGQIDILVNNAGTFSTKPFTEYTIEELDTFLGYLRGTFVLTQSAVRQMQKQGNGGSIVNIGTVLASNGVHGLPSSAPIASKGGVMALTKNLSVELAADNIRINAVAPGVVPTPLYGELSDEQLNALNDMQPLGRYGKTKDIADAVLYLAKATWITGVILPVDGGVDAGGDGAYHGMKKESIDTK